MYLSLQVSRNFSIWVGVIRSNWYSTRGWRRKPSAELGLAPENTRESALPAGKAIYLCCAIVVDAVFISGFLDLLRNPLNEFLYFLNDYIANINNSDDMMCFINFSNRQAHGITNIMTAKCIL